jgi:hypothetical protein
MVDRINEDELLPMPENHEELINQLQREYEAVGKGLAHGFQKDAIQNGAGARKNRNMKKACSSGWAFNFELVEIAGKKAVTFWDEGTHGLTGQILSLPEINNALEAGELGENNSDERLSRFSSLFESGGNLGAGMFGRGKMIFSAASKNKSLLVDSLREDKKYIAFERKIEKRSLRQTIRAKEDEEAKRFILEKTHDVMKPLETVGTRVAVLDVKEELSRAFELSFQDKNNIDSLYHMISETWWEIIKLGAKINLVMKGQVLTVGLTDDLAPLVNAEDGINGYRVMKKELEEFAIGTVRYTVKELKLVVSKDPLPKHLRGIMVQRKNMKVCNILESKDIHHTIQKNTFGYLRLDAPLETELEKVEDPTHYKFDTYNKYLGNTKSFIKSHITQFAIDLGYASESSERKTRNIANSALKELNEMANTLGLQTGFGGNGKGKKYYSLSIKSFVLPNQNTTRVEIGQEIGPLEYCFTNNSNDLVRGNFVIIFEQRNTKIEVYSKENISIDARDSKSIEIDKLKIEEGVFSNETLLIVRARFVDGDTYKDFANLSRDIWLGTEPPPRTTYLCDLTVLPMQYPRKDTPRVELGESLRNLGFSIRNKENTDFKLTFEVVVRRSKTEDRAVEVLHSLDKQTFVLKALSDYQWETHDLEITEEMFGAVFNDENTSDEYKKCEIFYRVNYAERYDEYKIVKTDAACSKKERAFYCGVDPTGQSIFKKVTSTNDENDPKRATTSGTEDDGYIFTLNSGHAAYKYIEKTENSDFLEAYWQEQMIYHSVLNAIHDGKFVGVLEDHQDLAGHELDSHTVATSVDLIMGKILQKLRS